jgi:ubiquinone/menaquinone biosynthesis C-methylase UbiE
MEHVQEINKAFEEMSRVLKPSGCITLIYPFEIIRGICAMGSAWTVSSSISKAGELRLHSISEARKQHINKLSPRKISTIIAGNGLRPKGSLMFMDPWPAYLTMLEKKK